MKHKQKRVKTLIRNILNWRLNAGRFNRTQYSFEKVFTSPRKRAPGLNTDKHDFL